jgi:hypothetical protein
LNFFNCFIGGYGAEQLLAESSIEAGIVGGLVGFHFVEQTASFPRNDRVSTIYGDKMRVDDTTCNGAKTPINSTKQAVFF